MNIQHVIFTIALVLATPAASQTAHQPYKGFEARNISSLSASDIEALENGTGWGLALPAELNGYPGPAHVLEHAGDLGLSEQQTAKVQAIYDAMKAEAMEKGKELIDAERRIDQGFKASELSVDALKVLIAQAEKARADLRFIHLSRHLATTELLSDEQISEYARLRGYASDPCQAVPAGHDAEMWRRHNGCEG